MYLILQIVTVFLVAIAMALPLAHALELPGKKRLDEHAYRATQPIYYPGFTIGAGIGEGGGMLALIALLALTPSGSAAFAWALAALLALLAMHLTYWLYTHPINKFWLQGERLAGAGAGFFGLDPLGVGSAEGSAREWHRLRDRWEHSHVLRAVLAGMSLACVVISVAL